MSAQITLAGLDVIGGRLTLPLSGVATGELELGGDALPLGLTELLVLGDGVDDVRFAVCVARIALLEGRILASIVAGRSGGLSRSPLAAEVPALHYDGDPTPVSAWEVLSDLCVLAGEELDPATEAPLSAFTAPSWLRESGFAHAALVRATRLWGLSARFLPSGELWAGVETWPLLDPEPTPVDPLDDGWTLYVAPPGATILPGVTYGEKQILRVEYSFADALRARLYYREDS